MTLRGRVVAITGAASGIGRALAVEIAARGGDVALCDVNEEELAETVSMVEGRGRRATRAVVDVADRAAVEAFRDQVLADFGHADAIVNNAGVSLTESVALMSYDDFEWIVGINFWGVVYGSKAFLPHLLERGDGWIVNLSSIFGIIAVPHQSAYNATKFAVRGFTEALRQECRGTGVTALSVHPGGIKTNIVRGGRFGSSPDGADRETLVKRFEERMAKTSAEDAAITIADAMERREHRVLVGPDAVLIDAVQRIFPVSYSDVVRLIEGHLRSD